MAPSERLQCQDTEYQRRARELGLPVKRLPGGAGHDAEMLASVCPDCLIFVPGVNGVGYNVQAPDDVAAGAKFLVRLMVELVD